VRLFAFGSESSELSLIEAHRTRSACPSRPASESRLAARPSDTLIMSRFQCFAVGCDPTRSQRPNPRRPPVEPCRQQHCYRSRRSAKIRIIEPSSCLTGKRIIRPPAMENSIVGSSSDVASMRTPRSSPAPWPVNCNLAMSSADIIIDARICAARSFRTSAGKSPLMSSSAKRSSPREFQRD
jgi:hypothetical protein